MYRKRSIALWCVVTPCAALSHFHQGKRLKKTGRLVMRYDDMLAPIWFQTFSSFGGVRHPVLDRPFPVQVLGELEPGISWDCLSAVDSKLSRRVTYCDHLRPFVLRLCLGPSKNIVKWLTGARDLSVFFCVSALVGRGYKVETCHFPLKSQVTHMQLFCWLCATCWGPKKGTTGQVLILYSLEASSWIVRNIGPLILQRDNIMGPLDFLVFGILDIFGFYFDSLILDFAPQPCGWVLLALGALRALIPSQEAWGRTQGVILLWVCQQ